jgi:quinol monooxygenase YgiN
MLNDDASARCKSEEGETMFLRLVQAKIKPENASRLSDAYLQGIMPALERTKGCLFAGLAQSTRQPEDVISLTLWTSREEAAA